MFENIILFLIVMILVHVLYKLIDEVYKHEWQRLIVHIFINVVIILMVLSRSGLI